MPQITRRILSLATLSAVAALLVKRRRPQLTPEGTWKDVTPPPGSPGADQGQ